MEKRERIENDESNEEHRRYNGASFLSAALRGNLILRVDRQCATVALSIRVRGVVRVHEDEFENVSESYGEDEKGNVEKFG